MKFRITYKALSLILGVLVALIIALFLWIKKPEGQTALRELPRVANLLPQNPVSPSSGIQFIFRWLVRVP